MEEVERERLRREEEERNARRAAAEAELEEEQQGRSPQSCTVTDFEMETSNFVLFLLISVVSVHFRAIYDDETIRCQA